MKERQRKTVFDIERRCNLHEESPDEHFIFQLELLVNLLHWAPKYELMNRGPFELTWMDDSTVSGEC